MATQKQTTTRRSRKRASNAGRPRGSKNADADVVTVRASRCVRCGSTERSEYWGKTVQHYAGTTSDGRPYTCIVRRRTRCKACGQLRIDKTFENRR